MELDSQYEQLEERLEDTADARRRLLGSYAAQDWASLAPVEQTVERLEYQTQRDAPSEWLDALGEDGPPIDVGDIVFEMILSQSERMPIWFIHRCSRIARSVGRIVFGPQRRPNGTGFLVSPRLLLTNCHVLSDRADAFSNLVQFDYIDKPDGSTVPPIEFKLQPDALFLQSPISELDCSLVAVESVNDAGVELSSFGWCTLAEQTGKEHPGERVNVIHHPGGLPKQVSLRENFVALILDDYLHYMTDGGPLSSGSPVFNDGWDVVALHHASREITDPEEIHLYRSAIEPGEPSVLDDAAVTVSEGARTSSIVEWFRHEAEALNGEPRTLLEEALVSAGALIYNPRRGATRALVEEMLEISPSGSASAFRLSGADIATATQAIQLGFPSLADLSWLARVRLGQDLDAITLAPNLSLRIFELLQWAEPRGEVVKLLEAAAEERPNVPSLKAIAVRVRARSEGQLESGISVGNARRI